MGQPLTTERRAQLQATVNAGNMQGYYSLLAQWGYQYGNLALGVVNNSGISGVTANAFLRVTAEANRVYLSDATMNDIRVELMRADWALRSDLGTDSTSDLEWRQYRDYHSAVFDDHGLPPDAWTAFTPLQLAGSSAAALWQQMLDAQSYWGQAVSGFNVFDRTAGKNLTYYNYTMVRLADGPGSSILSYAALAVDFADRAVGESVDEARARIWTARITSSRVLGALLQDVGTQGLSEIRSFLPINYDPGSAILLNYGNGRYQNFAPNRLGYDPRLLMPEIIEVPVYDDDGFVVGSARGYFELDGTFKELSSVVKIYDRDGSGKIKLDQNGQPIELGIIETSGDLSVQKSYSPGTKDVIYSDIILEGNPLPVDFSGAGSIIGQQLGYYLADGDVTTGIIYSGALKTFGDNLGDILDGIANGASLEDTIEQAFSEFDSELFGNLQAAGIGALSSYLTAELVNSLGVSGFAGELTNSVGGAVIQQVITNITIGADVLANVNPQMLATVAASFLGSKLGNAIYQPDTVGGQIGSAVGSGIGSIVAGVDMALFFSTGNPVFAVAAVVAVAFWQVLGGLIGSIFGGTPRSGADVEWDAKTGKFIVDNVWSKKGGSKQAARGMAQAAADTINAVIGITGGKLIDPNAVEAGNYGMRKKKYVHRDANDQIDFSVGGKDGAARAIGFGVYGALTDQDFQIMGGDIFVKRALYNSFELGGLDPANFDTNVLLGNLASAQRYETYLQNSTAINALIAAESDSVFAAEWAISLARAVELGLTRRAASDWFGGFNYILNELAANPANAGFRFEYDPFSGRIARAIDIGAYTMGDAIDVAGQDIIEGTGGNDTIVLTATQLAATNGATNAGLTVNGAAFNGVAKDIDVAAIVDAGAANDNDAVRGRAAA